jgi:predicted NUDIX family NTP pyrophosphohydrolase
MPVRSAGILLWRHGSEGLEVWIAHMGGPFWARKDERAWSIPKGEYDPADEDPLDAARREFTEETGLPAPDLPYALLGEYRYSSGKILTVFVAEAPDFDPSEITPGTFELEWPPRTGSTQQFAEIDRVEWVPLEAARGRLVAAQAATLDDLPG